MHTTDVGTANVPAFLTKLWKLVEDPVYNDLISWAPNGRSFVIKNQSRFSKELLPLYFKHNNMASFIRQLNMYGFRKLTSIENSGLKADKDDMEFYHQYFLKGQESLLEYIKRKVAAPVKGLNGGDESHFKSDDVKEILTDVRAIRDRQETTDSCLVNMQRENAALWKEIAVLRQKHQKQQQIVERLIQFLVTLVQNQQQNVHAMKRKTPLMIEGETESTSAKRLHSTKDHEAIQGGPVIHDVTNDFIDTELEAAANSNPVISLHQDNDESIDLLIPDLKSIPVATGTNIAATGVQPSPTNGIVVIPSNSGETLTVDDLTTDTSGNNIISNVVTDGTNSNNGIVMVPTGSGETYSTENLTTDTSGNNANSSVAAAVAAVAAAAAAAANVSSSNAAANAVASGDNSSNDGVIMIPTSSGNSQYTREYLSDQVESVDIELNWLQEQLQHGGLSFDPTVSDSNLSSLIEGDW